MCILCQNGMPQKHAPTSTQQFSASEVISSAASVPGDKSWQNIDQTPLNTFGKSTDYEAFLDYLGALQRDLTPEMAQQPIKVNLEELNNHPDYKAAAMAALQQWSTVTPLKFEFVTSGEYLKVVSPEVGEKDDGSAYSSGHYVSVGQRFHDTEVDKTAPGGYIFNTFIHEFGHEWGLNHPGVYNYGGPGGEQITYLAGATWVYDQQRYSVMSYFDGIDVGETTAWSATTPMVGDIEAVIRHYYSTVTNGVRTYQDVQLNTGNDVYGFGSTKLGYELKTTGNGHDIGFVIHDTGGFDTVDFSGSTAGTTLDLRAGRWSSVNGHNNNVVIYQGHNADATDYYIEKGVGSAFNDIILGNDGNNELIGGAGDDKIAGFAGNDRLYGDAGNDELDGGAGNDLLLGGAGNDYLDGGDGADSIRGGNGDDHIIGGRDSLASRDINNTIPISQLPDQTESLDGDDKLYGEGGNDIIEGGQGNDILDGGAGDDILRGQDGVDVFIGGAGSDTVDFSHESPFQLLVNLETNVASGGTATGDTFYSIENLIGSDDRIDRFIGNSADNHFQGLGGGDVFNGGDGNDILDGARDADILYGDAGDDILIGGAGFDYLNGGEGNDTAVYTIGADSRSKQGVNVNLATGVASGGDAEGNATGGAKGDILVSIENLVGSAYDDNLFGDAGVNRLSGGGGNDTIGGGAGKDYIDGGEGLDMVAFYDSTQAVNIDLAGNTGEDTLVSIEGIAGSSFDDTLSGTAGDNRLVGQGGNDTLNGGDGNDILDGDFEPFPVSGIGLGDSYATLGADATNTSFANAFDLTSKFSTLADADIANAETKPHSTVNAVGNGAAGYYKVTLNAGSIITVDIDHTVGAFDSYIRLMQDNGGAGIEVANNDDGGGDPGSVGRSTDSALTFTATTTGTYYIVVGNYDDPNSVPSQVPYEVNVSVAPPVPSMPHIGVAGNDTLNGGKGNDTLFGREGNDKLNGGVGNDTLSGGFGNDTFSFNAVGFGNDIISDFNIYAGEQDVLEFSSSIFGNLDEVLNSAVLQDGNVLLKDGNSSIQLAGWNDVNAFKQFATSHADSFHFVGQPAFSSRALAA